MAFSADDMNTIHVATGVHLHTYTTADTEIAVTAADYFLDYYENLNVGDQILAVVDTGGTAAAIQLAVLTASSAGVTTAVNT